MDIIGTLEGIDWLANLKEIGMWTLWFTFYGLLVQTSLMVVSSLVFKNNENSITGMITIASILWAILIMIRFN